MPNFRAIYPVDFTTSAPPATFRTGHVYELPENPSTEFFEETDEPVTGDPEVGDVEQPTADADEDAESTEETTAATPKRRPPKTS